MPTIFTSTWEAFGPAGSAPVVARGAVRRLKLTSRALPVRRTRTPTAFAPYSRTASEPRLAFACQCHGRPLEADSRSEFQPPAAQCAVAIARVRITVAASYNGPRKIVVAAARYMAVIIDFAGLIAPGCQANQGAHRARRGEGARIRDRRREGGDHRPHTGDRGEQPALRTLPYHDDNLPAQLRRLRPHVAPGVEQGQDDPLQFRMASPTGSAPAGRRSVPCLWGRPTQTSSSDRGSE